MGLPWRLSDKESVCQCQRRGFDPWVRKLPWRRQWHPTPVLLPGESHGQRSLVGCSPRGRTESDTAKGSALIWAEASVPGLVFLSLEIFEGLSSFISSFIWSRNVFESLLSFGIWGREVEMTTVRNTVLSRPLTLALGIYSTEFTTYLGSKKALRRWGSINWALKKDKNLKREMIQNEQSDRDGNFFFLRDEIAKLPA